MRAPRRGRHLGRSIAGALLLAGMLAGWRAEAQPKDPKALFDDGVALRTAGNCAAALPLLRESERLAPARGPLYNIALCEEQLGKLASAHGHLNELLPMLDPGDDRLSDVRRRIAALDLQVPRLRVDLGAGAPANAVVTLDGSEIAIGRLGEEMPVDPGDHRVTVQGPGCVESARDVHLDKQQRTRVTIAPSCSPSARAGSPATEGARAAGFAIGGVGLAGLVIAGVTGGIAMSKVSTINALCPTGPSSCQAGSNPSGSASSGKAFATVADVSAIAGLTFVAVGVTLVVVVGRPHEERAVAVAPTLQPNGGGMVATLTF